MSDEQIRDLLEEPYFPSESEEESSVSSDENESDEHKETEQPNTSDSNVEQNEPSGTQCEPRPNWHKRVGTVEV